MVLTVVSQEETGNDGHKTTVHLDGVSVAAEPVSSQGEPVSTEMFPVIGWTIPNLVGKTLTLDAWGYYDTDCFEGGGQGYSDEYMRYAHNSIRDGDGLLLFAHAYQPLRADQQAFVDPEATPEFIVGWVDAGCAPAQGSATAAVALTVRSSRTEDGTKLQQAKPGERMHLSLNGRPYTLAVAQARGPEQDGKHCGVAEWILYRDDFLIKKSQ